MGFLMDEMGLSERRSCRLVGLSRSVQQYRPAPRNDDAVVERMKELASANRRYGYLRLHVLLRREGLVVNPKRTYRLYLEQGLQVRTKKRRKLPRRDRVIIQVPDRPMQRWSLDFMSDQLADWRRFRIHRRRPQPLLSGSGRRCVDHRSQAGALSRPTGACAWPAGGDRPR